MIGIGIDAVDIPRFRELLARRPAIAQRLFTAGERALAATRADPAPALAARFAAKEATMKALGVGLGAFRFRDVDVVRLEGGRPALVLRGAAADLADQRGVGGWMISLTHSKLMAGAVVAAVR
jgi:holo-[acyl-carrier protein] synthase